MADVIYKKGQSSNLNNVKIKEGQILVTEDTGEMYIDVTDNDRKKINGLSNSKLGSAILIDDVSPVTHEMSVKISSDTVTDLTAVKVTRCGKNLLYNDTVISESTNTVLKKIWSGNLPAPFVFSEDLSQFTPTEELARAATFRFKFADGTEKVIGKDYEYLLVTTGILKEIYFVNIAEGIGTIKCQLEIGTVKTDYEPYVGTDYTPNADGTVNGITSLYPNTTLMTDTEGVIINCEYLTKNYKYVLDKKINGMSNSKLGSAIRIDDISPVTHEMSVKISSDTVTDLTAVKVTRCGKNLIQTNIIEVTSPTGVENLIWQGHISGKLFFSSDNSEYTPNPSNVNSANFKFVFGDGTVKYLAAYAQDMYLNSSSPLKEIYFLNWGKGTGDIKNIQLEIGSFATDYEPYAESTEYTPNADGTVSGVTSLYPNTTLITDTDGVIIDCEYLTKLYTEVFDSANIKNGFAVGSLRGIGAKEEDSSYTLGQYSVAEGKGTKASGNYSHAEGWQTIASGNYSHAEGNRTQASGEYAHAEGINTTASGERSHAEGSFTKASGASAHAEGINTTASGECSHAEGYDTIASGQYSHAQGKYNISNTTYADVIGNGTDTKRSNAYTMDWNGNAWFAGDIYVGSTYGTNKDAGSKKLTTNLVDGSSVGSIRTIGSREEDSSYTLGQYGVAEGYGTKASGGASHAEGSCASASGEDSHAEGFYTEASGSFSHAEGSSTTASGEGSHAEGFYTEASGDYSHAEGASTEASGEHSHAEGTWTIASGSNSHAQGKFNISNTTYADVIGNGTSDTKRSNAYTMDWKGNAWFAGDIYVGSKSGKNKDEGSKKLATVDLIYPVGSIYMSVNDTSPSILFGGEWERIEDRFLLAAGNTYSAGSKDGEAVHTLTKNEMPSHNHGKKPLEGRMWNIASQGITDTLNLKADGIVSTDKVEGHGYATNLTEDVVDGFKIDASHEHDSVGGGQPHNNMPPYLAVYMWKRTA